MYHIFKMGATALFEFTKARTCFHGYYGQ